MDFQKANEQSKDHQSITLPGSCEESSHTGLSLGLLSCRQAMWWGEQLRPLSVGRGYEPEFLEDRIRKKAPNGLTCSCSMTAAGDVQSDVIAPVAPAQVLTLGGRDPL